MAHLYWVELSLTSHHTQIWSCRVLLAPTSTAAAAHTLYCLYMGVYYTSVKRTQQLSGVTRIRTHDLLIRYLITKQWLSTGLHYIYSISKEMSSNLTRFLNLFDKFFSGHQDSNPCTSCTCIMVLPC